MIKAKESFNPRIDEGLIHDLISRCNGKGNNSYVPFIRLFKDGKVLIAYPTIGKLFTGKVYVYVLKNFGHIEGEIFDVSEDEANKMVELGKLELIEELIIFLLSIKKKDDKILEIYNFIKENDVETSGLIDNFPFLLPNWVGDLTPYNEFDYKDLSEEKVESFFNDLKTGKQDNGLMLTTVGVKHVNILPILSEDIKAALDFKKNNIQNLVFDNPDIYLQLKQIIME